tara:strand:+ start:1297 stop:1479 length:183 start_codon:yes stop_codon:yes gene_type:complete
MKDIKTLMIGFLLATCMFLMMGQYGSGTQIIKHDGSITLTIQNPKGTLFEESTFNISTSK